ncbi:hypothetical protein GCM10011507_28250 [Edaphobacter acidisoli]|uniref:DUF4352 domain-containing protein n=1 Tax=Edaphobacter acidisoli TaxID=2040573 RepID=A0A916S0B9_9BACT|nr:hypothetical protein [Edaphobacter acidisoli]GGA75226.1 hypothetical protein GCM10011507_28250 [Edaphobacter acidisoli]
MNLHELLLLGLAGWTAIGLIGTIVSFARRERAKALYGLKWLVAIWVVYLAVLLGVSHWQKQRVVAIGQPQCFDEMCFTVTGVTGMTGLPQDQRHLLRVSIEITNRGHKPESEALIQAYLIDSEGRLWGESPGLSGVRLTVKVPPGQTVVSEPVFAVSEDATGLKLVFTHGHWQPGALVIGDSDSLMHKRTVVPLNQ